MNQITTQVKNWIIIFKDKSQKYITEKEAEKIYLNAKGNSEFFFMDGQGYSYKVVAKIIPLKEYYDQYPEEVVPVEIPAQDIRHGEYPFRYLPLAPVKRKNALQKMIIGIKKSITQHEQNGHNPLNAKELLKKMELKLAEIN